MRTLPNGWVRVRIPACWLGVTEHFSPDGDITGGNMVLTRSGWQTVSWVMIMSGGRREPDRVHSDAGVWKANQLITIGLPEESAFHSCPWCGKLKGYGEIHAAIMGSGGTFDVALDRFGTSHKVPFLGWYESFTPYRRHGAAWVANESSIHRSKTFAPSITEAVRLYTLTCWSIKDFEVCYQNPMVAWELATAYRNPVF